MPATDGERIRGAWANFNQIYEALRNAKYSIKTKAHIIDKLIGAKITYGVCCFYTRQSQLDYINMVQRNMIAKTQTYHQGRTWPDKWIALRRQAKTVIAEEY